MVSRQDDTQRFIRPANATAYVAFDAVNNGPSPSPMVFRLGVKSGVLMAEKAILWTSLATCTARFKLSLYSQPPTMVADNAAFIDLFAERTILRASFTFPPCFSHTTGGTGAGAYAIADFTNADLPKELGYSDKLYGALSTLDAFTPASGQQFEVKLVATHHR